MKVYESVENAYQDYWAPSCCGGMFCFLKDVFFRETPMAPSKVTYLIECV